MVHFSHPPDKRPNFAKFNSQSPFLQPWNVLINNWSNNSSEKSKFDINDHNFYVERDPVLLTKLDLFTKSLCSKNKVTVMSAPKCDDHSLLAVRLEILGTGTMSPNTMISWASAADFSMLIDSKTTKI